MKRALGSLSSHIVHLAGGRPVNDQELEASLRLKADKVETDSLRKNKASEEDLNKAVNIVQNLEAQLKDSLVLFIE